MTLEESLLEKVRENAYKYALLNAIKHKGKAALQPVIAKIIREMPEVRRVIKQIIPIVKNIVDEVNNLNIEQQRRIIEEKWPELLETKPREEEKKLPPLPNAVMGKVTTRFAPNPDYTIHLGNARPALLSYWYAEMYNGQMILRFEDTDPRIKASFPEAYDRIKEELKWLGIKWSKEYIQSLRIPVYYEILRELIKRGGAYIDRCDAKTFKQYRDTGKPCPHRELPVEIHLEEFDKIMEGYYGEGEAVIRVKTDLKHPDPSVRDWVAARIIDTTKTPHPVVGERYILWPTYNLAAAIDDHLMGITHILRAKEHISNTIKQKYLYDHMGWKYPETIHFGRLSLEGVILSKSQMRMVTKEGGFQPYTDPRFGTIAGLRRRGITNRALWEIIKSVGTNPIDAHISYVNLASINRSIVDPIANRYMAVEDPLVLRINGLDDDIIAHVLRHPSRKDYVEYIVRREKPYVYISSSDLEKIREAGFFRLMGLGNLKLDGTRFHEEYGIVIEAHYMGSDATEAKKKHAPIIQWAPLNYVYVEMIIPEKTVLKRKVLYAEPGIMDEETGSIIQFYRLGFARIDEKDDDKIVAIFAHT